MAGHAKLSFSDFLKEPSDYLRQEVDFLDLGHFPEYYCPNCSEAIQLEYRQDHVKDCYDIRVKCNSCSFYGFSYISYEATWGMGLTTLISDAVEEIVYVDLLMATEHELEREAFRLDADAYSAF